MKISELIEDLAGYISENGDCHVKIGYMDNIADCFVVDDIETMDINIINGSGNVKNLLICKYPLYSFNMERLENDPPQ